MPILEQSSEAVPVHVKLVCRHGVGWSERCPWALASQLTPASEVGFRFKSPCLSVRAVGGGICNQPCMQRSQITSRSCVRPDSMLSAPLGLTVLRGHSSCLQVADAAVRTSLEHPWCTCPRCLARCRIVALLGRV